MGAGVPCPIHPKSHTHRSATANHGTDGTTAIQRHRAAPPEENGSTWKPNHTGNIPNHSAKNPDPTRSSAAAVAQFASFPACAGASDCARIMFHTFLQVSFLISSVHLYFS